MNLDALIAKAIETGNNEAVKLLMEKKEQEEETYEKKKKAFRMEASELLNNLAVAEKDMLVEGETDYAYASMEEISNRIRAAMSGLHLWYHVETMVDYQNQLTRASLILSHENGYSECWTQIAMPFVANDIEAHGIEASLTYARKAAMINGFNFVQKDDDAAVTSDGKNRVIVNPQKVNEVREKAERAVENYGLQQNMNYEAAMGVICSQLGLSTDSNRSKFTLRNWEEIEDRAKNLTNAQGQLNV